MTTTSMIIGIDARVLVEGSGGVFRYAKNLLEHLIPLAPKHQFKLFVNRYHKNPSPILDKLKNYPNVKIYSYRFPNKFLNASFCFKAWPQIDKLIEGADVLFFPSLLYGAWSDKVKTVLTMHDLSFVIYPEYFTYRQQLWHKLMQPRQVCHRVNKVIAVSEATRQDLLAHYKLKEAKVIRVHSGLEKDFRPIQDRHIIESIRQKYGLPAGKYLLQVGTIEPRKNTLATLAAFNLWQKKWPQETRDYHLLFAGHNGWKADGFYEELKKSSFEDKIHVLTEVPGADLPAIYNLASIFLYPSFYEGFGFPPLEAMASGVPVIAGHNSSLGEIINDAGILVDPFRIDDLVISIRAIVNEKDLAKDLRAKGLARTVEFTWEKTARETLNVLESI